MVAACLIAAAQGAIRLSSALLAAAAFLGALIAMGAVLLLSSKIRSMSLLIVGGVMIGYICTAATDILVHFASDADIVNLRDWTVGSFSGMKKESLVVCAWIVLAGGLAVFLLSKPIGAYQLGESYAQDMGVNIKAFRAVLILLSSVLSATVTAFAGPISFVGVAVPHLMRSLFKTAKPIIMIPACFLGGGVFCLLSDLIARTAFAPTELSISAVTALFGAPVVILVMLMRQREQL